jgi:hypothetical protein
MENSLKHDGIYFGLVASRPRQTLDAHAILLGVSRIAALWLRSKFLRWSCNRQRLILGIRWSNG